MDIDDLFNQAKERAGNNKEQNNEKENKGKKKDVDEKNKKENNKQKERDFVDIITFSESGDFLTGISLFPWQKIILKAFYMGAEGNEKLSFPQKNGN
jgi:negative regulator of genetic competence, sporulation and motility